MTNALGPALADALHIAFDDRAADWFSPVCPTVDGLDAAAAASGGAGAGRNAPWQVLEHLRLGYVAWGGFLSTGALEPAAFGGGREWQPIAEPTPAAWTDLRQRTRLAEAAFRDIVRGLTDEELFEPEPILKGSTRLDVILCTLAHLGFHAGELATLCASAPESA